MKYFSMFSGIGGFEYGIGEMAECIGYSEIDKYAEAIYRYHYPEHRGYGDATGIDTNDLPDFDLLVGGFPCQSFSIAGKRGGFSDSRGTLFFEIARILSDKRPRYILLENVKGLLSHESGQTFATILGVLSDTGYLLQWEVLNSCNFGVPQNRERVFIIGHLAGTARPKVFPIGEGTESSVRQNEAEWLSEGDGIAYCLDSNYQAGLGKYSRTMVQVNGKSPQGQRIYDPNGLSSTISKNTGGQGRSTGLYMIDTRQTRDGVRISDNVPWLNKSMSKDIFKIATGKHQQDAVHHPDGIMSCLAKGTHGSSPHLTKTLVGKQIRRLTPIEAERLQGFPDSWTKWGLFDDGMKEISDTQRYNCLGNAVTTNVIRAIMERFNFA